MPRLKQVSRSEVTSPEVEATYQWIFGDRDPTVDPGTSSGSPGNWWTVIALEPNLFAIFRTLDNWQISADRKIAPQLRYLATARAGWAHGSQFIFSQYCKLMRTHGFTEEQIQAIPTWASEPCFDARERVVLAYCDDLVLGGGRSPDARFGALKSLLSDVEILELTFMICRYDMAATMSRALRLEYDDRPDPVVEMPGPSSFPPPP